MLDNVSWLMVSLSLFCSGPLFSDLFIQSDITTYKGSFRNAISQISVQ